MLRSRGEHQRQFRHGGKSGSRSIEQKLADLFSGRSSAWLAGCHYARTLRTQHVCQLLDLRALAAAVQASEAYGRGRSSASQAWTAPARARRTRSGQTWSARKGRTQLQLATQPAPTPEKRITTSAL